MPRLRLCLAALLVGGSFVASAVPAAHARTYDQAVLDHSMYYWRLGESGTFSPDRNLGVGTTGLYGRQVTPEEPGALTQDDNGSVRLFGATPDGLWESNVTIDPDGADVSAPNRRAFAWEIWIKPAMLDGNTRRIVSAETVFGGYLIGASNKALAFSRYQKSPDAWHTLSVPAPPVGAWTHVAATYDGTEMALYVNGALAARRTSTLPLATWSSPPAGSNFARLGSHSFKWLEWDGWLDEASFSRTLPADAIAEHFALGTR
jgi:hypothetical protein